ncbi:MAG: exodeoxyribonuclease III [Vicingaceae bacterium]
MKVISYNINGIRAVLKKDFLTWLEATDPDVLCLQEVKALEQQFDQLPFRALGYEFYLFPAQKKGYSGVAILTKEKPKRIVLGCGIEKYDAEGRVIRCDFKDYSVMSVYMPSGASKPERQVFKLEWLDFFQSYMNQLKKELPKLLICGDFNLCHRPIDIHNPYGLDGYPGFTEEERQWMSAFLDNGFVDLFRAYNSAPHQYSWWSYRSGARQKNLGWRIDYILGSQGIENTLKRAAHLDRAIHSDHCPVMVEIA